MTGFDRVVGRQGFVGLLAVAIGLIYWPLEALIHSVFFDQVDFIDSLLYPTANEAWMRGLVVVLFIFFGVFIYRLQLRQDGYISQLEMLKEALEHAGEGIIITDAHGKILYVNHAFHRTTGFSYQDAIGKNPSILQSGKQDANFYRDMWKTIQQKGEWCGRIWNRRKNGEIYPEQLHICAIRNSSGATRYHVGVFFDITEQLRLEEQLRQSQKLEAIGTLVGGIAHDFNNILTSMTGNLFLVKMELDDCTLANRFELMGKLDLIENEGFRAAGMIQHLLAFARKGVVQLQAFDWAPSVQSIVDLARPSIPRTISMHRSIASESLPVFGDKHQLEQVIINLLNNAADALRDCVSPQVEIRLEACMFPRHLVSEHPLTSCVKLSISDNGKGIAPANLERIFEPFFTTKDVGEGTGLGLSMVYGAIQIHKGHIEVQSTPGKGTEVAIYLPLYRPDAAQGVKVNPPVRKEASPGHSLLVYLEDDAHLRTIVVNQLHSLGCTVTTVATQDEMFSALDSSQVHAVVLDAATPQPIIDELNYRREELLLILLYDRDSSIEHNIESEASLFYLKKPAIISDLQRALRKLR